MCKIACAKAGLGACGSWGYPAKSKLRNVHPQDIRGAWMQLRIGESYSELRQTWIHILVVWPWDIS